MLATWPIQPVSWHHQCHRPGVTDTDGPSNQHTGLRRLVVNHVLPDPGGAAPAYDAIVEDWFDSPGALQVALASPEAQAINVHASNLLDLALLQFFVVQEEEGALPALTAG